MLDKFVRIGVILLWLAIYVIVVVGVYSALTGLLSIYNEIAMVAAALIGLPLTALLLAILAAEGKPNE